jgi:hypothetical protein
MKVSPTALKLRFLTTFRSFRLFPLVLVHPQLNTFNPSVAMRDGKIFFCVRHSNVPTVGNRRYFGLMSAIAGSVGEFVNQTSFGILRIPEWGQALDCTLFEESVLGFEDLRIFQHEDRWYALGSRPELELVSGAPSFKGSTMHLIAFDQNFRITGTVALPSPYGAPWEKNWVPFHKNEALHLVYRPSPLIVFSLDFNRQGLQLTLAFQGQAVVADWSGLSESVWSGLSNIAWSGSSQIIPFGDGSHLGVIHRKFVFSDEVVFEHAFVRINEAFEMEISQPFHFMTFGEEFCAGLVVRQDDVVLSFGSNNDTRSYIATLGRSDVLALFGPG